MAESEDTVQIGYSQMNQLFGVDVEEMSRQYELKGPKDFFKICFKILNQYVEIYSCNDLIQERKQKMPRKDKVSPYLVNQQSRKLLKNGITMLRSGNNMINVNILNENFR